MAALETAEGCRPSLPAAVLLLAAAALLALVVQPTRQCLSRALLSLCSAGRTIAARATSAAYTHVEQQAALTLDELHRRLGPLAFPAFIVLVLAVLLFIVAPLTAAACQLLVVRPLALGRHLASSASREIRGCARAHPLLGLCASTAAVLLVLACARRGRTAPAEEADEVFEDAEEFEPAPVCCICLDAAARSDGSGSWGGLRCGAPAAHFTCADCLQAHVAHESEREVSHRTERRGRVRCPLAPSECDATWTYADAELARALPHVAFEAYIESRLALSEVRRPVSRPLIRCVHDSRINSAGGFTLRGDGTNLMAPPGFGDFGCVRVSLTQATLWLLTHTHTIPGAACGGVGRGGGGARRVGAAQTGRARREAEARASRRGDDCRRRPHAQVPTCRLRPGIGSSNDGVAVHCRSGRSS